MACKCRIVRLISQGSSGKTPFKLSMLIRNIDEHITVVTGTDRQKIEWVRKYLSVKMVKRDIVELIVFVNCIDGIY